MSTDLPPEHDLTEEHQLAKDAYAGDTVAQHRLFDEYHEPLCRFVSLRMDARLRTRLDASDIVQETLMEAHRRLNEFVQREELPLRVWLYGLAFKQLGHARTKHQIREKRSTKREERFPDRSSLVLAKKLMRHSTPSKHAVKREHQRQLSALIQQLGTLDRDILLMRHTEGLSYNDISTVLEISAASARQKYVRALVLLRELCVNAGLEGDVL